MLFKLSNYNYEFESEFEKNRHLSHCRNVELKSTLKSSSTFILDVFSNSGLNRIELKLESVLIELDTLLENIKMNAPELSTNTTNRFDLNSEQVISLSVCIIQIILC